MSPLAALTSPYIDYGGLSPVHRADRRHLR